MKNNEIRTRDQIIDDIIDFFDDNHQIYSLD